jgi:hypothetical protein
MCAKRSRTGEVEHDVFDRDALYQEIRDVIQAKRFERANDGADACCPLWRKSAYTNRAHARAAKVTNGDTWFAELRSSTGDSHHGLPSPRSMNRNARSTAWNRTWMLDCGSTGR